MNPQALRESLHSRLLEGPLTDGSSQSLERLELAQLKGGRLPGCPLPLEQGRDGEERRETREGGRERTFR